MSTIDANIALDKVHTLGDYRDFIELIAKSVEESFEPYWFVLGEG